MCCILSVGPLLVPRTLNVKVKVKVIDTAQHCRWRTAKVLIQEHIDEWPPTLPARIIGAYQNQLRDPGIEPGSVPWQGTILPLNQPRLSHEKNVNTRVCQVDRKPGYTALLILCMR